MATAPRDLLTTLMVVTVSVSQLTATTTTITTTRTLAPPSDEFSILQPSFNHKDTHPKRSPFSAWAGKRAEGGSISNPSGSQTHAGLGLGINGEEIGSYTLSGKPESFTQKVGSGSGFGLRNSAGSLGNPSSSPLSGSGETVHDSGRSAVEDISKGSPLTDPVRDASRATDWSFSTKTNSPSFADGKESHGGGDGILKHSVLNVWGEEHWEPAEEDVPKRAAFSAWSGKRGYPAQPLVAVLKRKPFSVWAGKRNQPPDHSANVSKRSVFSAWAGKRANVLGSSESSVENISKRGPFSVWAGKRNPLDRFEDVFKRAAFSAWAGKRAHPLQFSEAVAEGNPFSPSAGKHEYVLFSFKNNPKRSPFSAWAGKRGNYLQSSKNTSNRDGFNVLANGHDDTDESSHSFSSTEPFSGWAAKGTVSLPAFESVSKRPAFSSWAGKRSHPPQMLDHVTKRAQFSAWAGKRNHHRGHLENMSRRSPFSAWAGKRKCPPHSAGNCSQGEEWRGWKGNPSEFVTKRSLFSAWAGKRLFSSSPLESVFKKAAFSAWAGKREFLPQSSEHISKRGPFSAWAGKRNHPQHLDNHIKGEDLNQWAGTRTFSLPPLENVSKRAAFSAWAGKRKRNSSPVQVSKRDLLSAAAGEEKDQFHRHTDSAQGESADVQAGEKQDHHPLQSSPPPSPPLTMDGWKPDARAAKSITHPAAFNSQKDRHTTSPLSSLVKRSTGIPALQLLSFNLDYHDISRRRAFNSWAGRKRAAFGAWRGKRLVHKNRATSPEFLHSGKRSAFRPWAGKRSLLVQLLGEDTPVHDSPMQDISLQDASLEDTSIQDTPVPYSPMQENPGPVQEEQVPVERKRPAAFSAWAGKRAGGSGDGEALYVSNLFTEPSLSSDGVNSGGKRAAFSVWAGKRSRETQGRFELDDDDGQYVLTSAVNSSASFPDLAALAQGQRSPLDLPSLNDGAPSFKIPDVPRFSNIPLPAEIPSPSMKRTALPHLLYTLHPPASSLSSLGPSSSQNPAVMEAEEDSLQLPSKRLWHGHMGLLAFTRWYHKKMQEQRKTMPFGKYLHRVISRVPMKRTHSTWPNTVRVSGKPDFDHGVSGKPDFDHGYGNARFQREALED